MSFTVNLPHETIDIIYEGMDPDLWEPATGSIFNRTPKQLQENVVYLKDKISEAASNASIAEVALLSDLLSPLNSGALNYSIREGDFSGAPIIVSRKADNVWGLHSYKKQVVSNGTVTLTTNTTLDSVEILSTSLPDISSKKYIIQMTSGNQIGNCRFVTSNPQLNRIEIDPFGDPPDIGDTFNIYRSDYSFFSVLESVNTNPQSVIFADIGVLNNTYIVNSIFPLTLTNGQKISFVAANESTDACTFTFNGTTYNLTKAGNLPVTEKYIGFGSIVTAMYITAGNRWEITAVSSIGSGGSSVGIDGGFSTAIHDGTIDGGLSNATHSDFLDGGSA